MKLLKLAAYAFFIGYVVLLVAAGAWGLFFATFDFDHVLGLSLADADPQGRTNMLSQYRFLRAVEFGVGLLFIYYRHDVFNNLVFNRFFLLLMTAGVLARTISLITEGSPSPIFYSFLASELVGAALIYLYTRKTTLAKA